MCIITGSLVNNDQSFLSIQFMSNGLGAQLYISRAQVKNSGNGAVTVVAPHTEQSSGHDAVTGNQVTAGAAADNPLPKLQS